MPTLLIMSETILVALIAAIATISAALIGLAGVLAEKKAKKPPGSDGEKVSVDAGTRITTSTTGDTTITDQSSTGVSIQITCIEILVLAIIVAVIIALLFGLRGS